MGLFNRQPRVDKAAEAAAAAAARSAVAAARGPLPFDTFRFNISCKCAKDRMELQKNKALNSIRKSERGVAELLRTDQNALARLQMQSIIREQLGVEALQLAAVYVELLRARSRVVAVTPTLDAAPPDVREAVINAAFADAHMDVKELREAVTALRAHFGPVLDTVLAGPDAPIDSLSRGVDNQLVLKLRAPVADSVLVTGRLVEVAAQYGVEWVPPVDGLHNASVADGGAPPAPPSYGSAPPGGGAPYGGGAGGGDPYGGGMGGGQGGYAPPPAPGGYGAPPVPGGYGAPPAPGGYGAPPPPAPYGADGGYGGGVPPAPAGAPMAGPQTLYPGVAPPPASAPLPPPPGVAGVGGAGPPAGDLDDMMDRLAKLKR
ncbi:hypothetical protein MMPV_008099 [Pyropia vietnamensis]